MEKKSQGDFLKIKVFHIIEILCFLIWRIKKVSLQV